MRWPWQSQPEEASKDNVTSPGRILDDAFNPTTFIAAAGLATLFIASSRVYQTRLTRIPTAAQIPENRFHHDVRGFPKRHTLFGRIVRVSDGDGIRLYHTPGGRLAGWAWFRRIPSNFPRRKRSENARSSNDSQGSWLAENTVNVRLSGIDAPELAHFGHPAQPGGEEATQCLKNYALDRWARVYPHNKDQYGRVVATVFTNYWHIEGLLLPRIWKDVGAEVVKAGWATVYEGKFGAMFGGKSREEVLKNLEDNAKDKQLGIWRGERRIPGPKSNRGPSDGVLRKIWRLFSSNKQAEMSFESPREFKARMKSQDGEEKAKR